MTRITIAILFALTVPAAAKDQSQVPQSNVPFYSEMAQLCVLKTTVTHDKKRRMTTATREIVRCRPAIGLFNG